MVKNEIEKFEENELREKIYNIRGFQVMLDSDLAELYGVGTKVLNQAVKRNIVRFPEEFCFELTGEEVENLRSQIVTSSSDKSMSIKANLSENANLRSQFVTSSWGGRRYHYYVFTEQGVAMLSAVLKSEVAVKVSILIIKAFIEMRKYLISNAQIFYRLDRVELNQIESNSKLNETNKRIDQVFSLMESGEIKPKQGIYYENQAYDAYKFVSDIFRSAKKSIIIIDNYVDDSVLTLLSKRNKGVKAVIYTKTVSDQLRLDVKKFNEQYESVELIEFKNSHDRFIIIDDKIIYHFGASLKDLGKKWFGFSRMDIGVVEMLSRLGK